MALLLNLELNPETLIADPGMVIAPYNYGFHLGNVRSGRGG